MTHPLDNCAYAALTSTQAGFALTRGPAARYRPDVSPIAGVAEPSAEALDALAELAGPGGVVALLDPPQLPDVFETLGRVPLSQWTCDKLVNAPPDDVDWVTLGAADADAMIELTKATDPGPWERNTYQLGDYLGVRDGTTLAAMAGERMCLPAFSEVSAVCTAADYGGRGYAQRLVAELMRRQLARGTTPFLHVRAGSPAEAVASRVYAKLGFVVRWRADIVVARRRE